MENLEHYGLDGLDRVINLLRMRPSPGATIDQRRLGFEALAANFPIGVDADITQIRLAATSCLRLAPRACAAPKRHLLYLHGGAFALGSAQTHAALAWRLAAPLSAVAVVPDYPLAPETPFPCGLDACWEIYRQMAEEDGPLFLCGDSAGANLALAVLLRARSAGIRQPNTTVLFSPWVDLSMGSPSIQDRAGDDPFISQALLTAAISMYLGDRALARTPEVSPLYADLSNLSPIVTFVGERELLLDDAIRLHQKLRGSNGSSELRVGAGLIHVWPFFTPWLPAGAAAEAQAVAYLREHLGAD